jgi:hypothetical protein
MTTTVLSLIIDSMQDAGIIAADEVPTNTEAQKCFRLLNRMLDTWSTENLMIYNNVQEVFSLAAGQQTYTIGTGGDFNTSRPVNINQAYMRGPDGDNSTDLRIAVWTYDEYANIISKEVTSSIALGIYYNSGYPLSEITLWPVVTDSTWELVLWSWKVLSSFTALTDTVSFPPGYENAIESNLAATICAAFQRPISPDLAVWATQSKAQLKRINVEIPQLGMPARLVGMSGSTFPISPHILTGY